MSDIFLSYASEDRRRVQNLYRSIKNSGLQCWMDKPPRPWQKSGIRPGEDWDNMIRQNLLKAKVILAILSSTSVKKSGYVQKEFRLALQVASERPPNTIAVIPVLLEQCKPPEIRIDTISFGQFQWYELFRYGIDELIQHLRSILGYHISISSNTPIKSSKVKSDQDSTILLECLSFFKIRENTLSWEHTSLSLFMEALSLIKSGEFSAAQDHLKYLELKAPVEVLLNIRKLKDRYIATLLMIMVIEVLGHFELKDEVHKTLRKLIPHKIIEVELLATALLNRRKGYKTRFNNIVFKYAKFKDRLIGFHDYLRRYLDLRTLIPLLESQPHFVWEIFANNPQFPMKGMRFLPIMKETKKLASFSTSSSWEAREIGVSTFCADTSISLDKKLPFLLDEEPRVRFRTLEGILMNWHIENIQMLIDTIERKPFIKKNGRSFSAKYLTRKPPLYIIQLDDNDIVLPLPVSYWFGHDGLWRCIECADVSRCKLTGIIVLSPEGKDSKRGIKQFKSLIISNTRSNIDHWLYGILIQNCT